ncbi:glycosyltransferase [Kribbella jejuensis]
MHVHNTFPLFSASVLRAAYRLDLPVVATLHNFRLLCANAVLQRDGRPCESCIGKLPLAAVRHACYRESRVQTLPLATSIGVHNTLHTWQRYVDTFVVPSGFVRDRYVAAGFDAERFVVKPHAVPHEGPARSGPGDAVVFLGRLSEDKGFADLLQAWDSTLGRLVVVGDGPLRAEAEERARKDLSVQVLGQLPWASGMDVLRTARVAVVPARSYESFGLVVVEAFAHGVPVVASRLGALAELVDDGETGALTEPGDPESLRKAIGLMADPVTSIACGERARQVYLERFTPERDQVATERIYTDAIARHAARDRSRAGRWAGRAPRV